MVLHVLYKTIDGKRNDFMNEIKQSNVLELIKKEDGCISYTYYLDAFDPNIILLVEEWESKEKQQIHLSQEHMKVLSSIKNKYVIDTTVRVL